MKVSMMNSTPFKQFIINYWLYYRELEDEFLFTNKYVCLHENNFKTYSIEFLKLYQAICSEIDVIGKAMAVYINDKFKPEDRANNIYKWWYEIQNKYTISSSNEGSNENEEKKLNQNTEFFLDTIEITPWKDFEIEVYFDADGHKRFRLKNCKVPSWWTDHNKVKHNRTSKNMEDTSKLNYCKANLGNVCYALAALYTLEKAYMQKTGTKAELEAFADYSKCFDKEENITSEWIEEAFNNESY